MATLAVVGALASCETRQRELAIVPATNVSGYEPSVQAAIARARSEVDRVAVGHPSDPELAEAYGNLAMTYHAHEIVGPAEPAYANARMLAPRDKRWPYLMGHLYNDSARQEKAIEAFEAAIAIDSKDPATIFSRAEVSLQHGDIERAATLFHELERVKEAHAAALAGLGKVALAKRDYAKAADYLEGALREWPTASRLRAPLAVAYRGLGNREKADEVVKMYAASGTEPGISDPVADLLSSKVAASQALVRRGQRYGQAGRFDLAEEAFRAAAEANPKDAGALANWGIALANIGRTGDAQQRLAESLAIDDKDALAHFSLGAVYDRQGDDARAAGEYEAALKLDQSQQQARIYLADLRMRTDNPDQAATLYRGAVDASPSERSRMSLALAYVKARRYANARRVLEAGIATASENKLFLNALARILAAAPEASLRDGPRALQMAKALFEATRSPDVGQTYAMALAETGDFERAVSLQRETVIAYERMGDASMKPFLQKNLASYEHHQAPREPWPADDPIFKPRSPGVALVNPRG